MTTGNDTQTAGNLRQQRRDELNALIQDMTIRLRQIGDPYEWSEVELTMPQVRALDLLVTGPHRMSDIAATLGTSMQATTSLIDRLVDKGLIERGPDANDRRVVLCRLTEAGLAEMERFYLIGQARMDVLIDLLSEDELDTVTTAFRVLASAAQRWPGSGTTTASDPTNEEKEFSSL